MISEIGGSPYVNLTSKTKKRSKKKGGEDERHGRRGNVPDKEIDNRECEVRLIRYETGRYATDPRRLMERV